MSSHECWRRHRASRRIRVVGPDNHEDGGESSTRASQVNLQNDRLPEALVCGAGTPFERLPLVAPALDVSVDDDDDDDE